MSNTELKQYYTQFIAMIGNQPDGLGDGLGLHGFLNDVADHLRSIAAKKNQAWRDSDFSLPDNGSSWIKDAEALEVITGRLRPKVKVFAELAGLVAAWENCQDSGNSFASNHEETIERIMKETAPSGAGFDNGTHLDLNASEPEKLVLTFDFHHHDETGYCGWTSQTATVTPSFMGGFDIELTIDGESSSEDWNEEDFREHAHESLAYWLESEIILADFQEKA